MAHAIIVLMNQVSVLGGISTCLVEELIFILDSLYDHIITTDGTGGVLDYIGHALPLCTCVIVFGCI